MDRDSTTRFLVYAILFGVMAWFLWGRKSTESVQQLPGESYVDAPDFAPDSIDVVPPGRPAPMPSPPAQSCNLHGNRFEAELSTRGAGIVHYWLTDARYAESAGHDISTTPDIERWRNLREEFRDRPGAPTEPDDQVRYDRFNWKLEGAPGPSVCRFSYSDDQVRILKSVSVGERPFEVIVETTLTNLSSSPRTHAMSIGTFAYRTNGEVKGKLGRVSPFQTTLECARTDGVHRKGKDDDVFKNPPYRFEEPLDDRYADIANYYFAQAMVPLEAGPGGNGDKPTCSLLAEQWFGAGQKPDDEKAGAIYHATLTYPKRTLEAQKSATYRQTVFFGPKERDVLAVAAGGWPRLGELIDLGKFSPVAKVLVSIISWINTNMTLGNWGLAIIVLTVGLRIALFPLTWKQIQSTIAMRRLKPEIDALNVKFKDDAQAKNLAMMELWRKHKVNPLGGCLPALAQMPIWFALYATLQTAVEFYHTKFLWFKDLSAPDPFFILPLVLGGAMIVQSKIVPQQGMDPMQQKMMTWMMPLVFTVMMLFLPAALGVYMLTNSVLGITQQLVIEKLYPRGPSGTAAGSGDGASPPRGNGTPDRGPRDKGKDKRAALTASLRKEEAGG